MNAATSPGSVDASPLRIFRRSGSGILVVAVVVVLGVLPGPQNALILLGVVTTFFQPLQTFVAAWTGWRARTWAGAVGIVVALTVLAAAATVAAQWAVGRIDYAGLVTTRTHEHGHAVLSAFPVLITPAALMFVAFLQITVVWESWPFDRLRAPWGGVAALAASTLVAIIAYASLANWHALPPALHTSGLREPNGPIAGGDIATWLICVAAWQVIVMIVFQGLPGALLRHKWARIAANNVVVIGAAWLSYLIAYGSHIASPTVAAVAGCVVGGARVALVLRATDEQVPLARRVAAATACSVGLYVVLWSVTTEVSFTTQPAGLWIAVVALNLVSGSVTFATDLRPQRVAVLTTEGSAVRIA